MDTGPRPLPSLNREVVWGIALIATAAITLAVVTTLVAGMLRPGSATIWLLVLVAADVAVLFVFSRHVMVRLVLKPVEELARVADTVGDGNLDARAAPGTTREFAFLAERFNRMTERLIDAQEEVGRAEKLASVGRLAAGVAHEVGNPLAAINTYLELLRRRGGDAELVASIERETGRIERIVKGLVAYAKPHEEALGSVDVGTAAASVVELLESQGALRGVEMRLEIAGELPPVRGKAHTLEHVFINLILNAVDAAPGGTITVGVAASAYRSEDSARRATDSGGGRPDRRRTRGRPKRPDVEDGTPGVIAWVSDAGPGVPLEDRDLIFDPFFTTKDPGRGTGLGLAIVQRIVYEMGGLVWVDDARERGASFKLFLPSTDRGTRT